MRPVIVSGGQTGVDRAALDWALARGFRVDGWCPKGRRAEDGKIPERFPLRETSSRGYAERTRRNVAGTDATLIIVRRKPSGGTALTARVAMKEGKPFFVATLGETPAEMALLWLLKNLPRRLNVAGPRASQEPGIGGDARRYLSKVFRNVRFASALSRVPRPGKNGRRRLVGPRASSRA